MKFKVIIPDLNRNIQTLDRINAAKRKAIKIHVIRTGLTVRGQAMMNQTPHVKTGVLRGSIDMTNMIMNADLMEVEVGSDVEYAWFHENDYPYLRPAAEAERDDFIMGLRTILGRKI